MGSPAQVGGPLVSPGAGQCVRVREAQRGWSGGRECAHRAPLLGQEAPGSPTRRPHTSAVAQGALCLRQDRSRDSVQSVQRRVRCRLPLCGRCGVRRPAPERRLHVAPWRRESALMWASRQAAVCDRPWCVTVANTLDMCRPFRGRRAASGFTRLTCRYRPASRCRRCPPAAGVEQGAATPGPGRPGGRGVTPRQSWHSVPYRNHGGLYFSATCDRVGARVSVWWRAA